MSIQPASFSGAGAAGASQSCRWCANHADLPSLSSQPDLKCLSSIRCSRS